MLLKIMFLVCITSKIVLMLRDNIILGADSDISSKDLIHKRIMTAFVRVTVKLIIISDKNLFRFFITFYTVSIFTK
jgi:hypothetical protein